MAEKEHSIPEVAQALAKTLKDKVDAYAEDLRKLRERELQKAEKSRAKPLAKNEVCPLCGNFDRPGCCTCLKKSQGPLALKLSKNAVAGYGPQVPGTALAQNELCKECGEPHKAGKHLKKVGDPLPPSDKKSAKPGGVKKDELKPSKAAPEKAEKDAVLPGDKDAKEIETDGSGEIKKGKGLKKNVAPAAKPFVAKLRSHIARATMHPETRASLDELKKLPAAKPKASIHPDTATSLADVKSLAGPKAKVAAPGAAPTLPGAAPIKALPGKAGPGAKAKPKAASAGAKPKKAPPRQINAAQALKEDKRAAGVGFLNNLISRFRKPVVDAEAMENGAGQIQNNLRRKRNAADNSPVRQRHSPYNMARVAALFRSEEAAADLVKALGDCLLCGKAEHGGECK